MELIIPQPCHPSHLCQDPDSISRTFLKQFVLVVLQIFLTSHVKSKSYELQLYIKSHPFPGKTNCLSEAAPIGRMPFTEVVGAVASRSHTFCTFATRSDITSAPNLQVFDAAPGTYYLLLEARKTLDNLGLTLTLGDSEYLRLIS